MSSARHQQRVPNRWGKGERLRQDILETATRILEEGGREEVLSLRAIAREVGIAAPSVYLHFKDKTELIWAVLDVAYSALAETMGDAGRTAADGGADGWAQLHATTTAYRRYALRNPRRYRLMFSMEQEASVDRARLASHPLRRVQEAWCEAVDRYRVPMSPEARSANEQGAMLLWTGLHGQLALWHAMPPAVDEARLLELERALLEAVFPREGS